jgi:uncharacterized membrane protein YhaH (DUF805 family)
MFRFSGRIGPNDYLKAIGLRAVAFAVLQVGLLGLGYGGALLFGNAPAAGMAVFFTVFLGLGPIVLALFMLSAMAVSVRRARDAGLSPWVGVFAPAVAWVDNQAIGAVGIQLISRLTNPLGGASSFWTPPPYATLAVALVMILSFVPSRPGRIPLRALGSMAIAVIVLAGAVAVIALADVAFSSLDFATMAALAGGMRVLTFILPFAMGALIVTSGLLTLRLRKTADRDLPLADQPELHVPVFILGLAAAAISMVFLALGWPDPFDQFPFGVVMGVSAAGLPTFALVFGLLIALFLAIRSPSLGTAVFAIAMLTPFAGFAYQHLVAGTTHAADEAAVAALPRIALTRYPAVAVVEGESGRYVRDLLDHPTIEAVIVKDGETLTRHVLKASGRGTDRLEIAGLPGSYLRVLAGRDSAFDQDGVAYELNTPFEIRYISPDRDDLIAAWYRTRVVAPTAWPVLTLSGWARDTQRKSGDDNRAFSAFVATALIPSTR